MKACLLTALTAAAFLTITVPNVAHAQAEDLIEAKYTKIISELESLNSKVQADQNVLQNTILSYIRRASVPGASVEEVSSILSESNKRIPGLKVQYRKAGDYCPVLKRLQDWRGKLNERLVAVMDQQMRWMDFRYLYSSTKLHYDIEQFKGENFDKQALQEVYARAIVDLNMEDPTPSELQAGWSSSGEEVEKLLMELADDVDDPCA